MGRHGPGKDEAPYEEEDDGVGEWSEDRCSLIYSEEDAEDRRKEGGGRDGDGLSDPVDEDPSEDCSQTMRLPSHGRHWKTQEDDEDDGTDQKGDRPTLPLEAFLECRERCLQETLRIPAGFF